MCCFKFSKIGLSNYHILAQFLTVDLMETKIYPPYGHVDPGTEPSTFQHKEYDISPCCFSMCCPVTLILEPEYVVVNEKNCCAQTNKRIAYADVAVDTVQCLCCYSVNNWSPGFGCDKHAVDEMASELQRRIGKRGNTGQIQKTEETLMLMHRLNERVDVLENKLDQVLSHLERMDR